MRCILNDECISALYQSSIELLDSFSFKCKNCCFLQLRGDLAIPNGSSLAFQTAVSIFSTALAALVNEI